MIYKIYYGFKFQSDSYYSTEWSICSIEKVYYLDLSDIERANIINDGYYWYGVDTNGRNIFIIDINTNISDKGVLAVKNDIIRYNRENKLDELI